MPGVTPSPPIVRPRSPVGLSTLITSAPWSARICVRERPDDDRRQVDDAYAFERTAGHARYVKAVEAELESGGELGFGGQRERAGVVVRPQLRRLAVGATARRRA